MQDSIVFRIYKHLKTLNIEAMSRTGANMCVYPGQVSEHEILYVVFAQPRVVTLHPCHSLGSLQTLQAVSIMLLDRFSKLTSLQTAFIEQNNGAVSFVTLRGLQLNVPRKR